MSDRAGAARWLSIHDDLLRGLAHAMSNRVATVSAAASLFDEQTLPHLDVLEGLRGEAERLGALLLALRLLPRRGDGALEPMMASDAVHAALTLIAHHPEFRNIACRFDPGHDVPPIRAEPGAVAHALCAALCAATRIARAARLDGVLVHIESTGSEVHVYVTAEGAHAGVDAGEETVLDATAATWLLSASHAHAKVVDGGCVLVFPTLAASRQRQ